MSIQPPEEERFHSNVVDLTKLVRDLVGEAFSKGYHIIQPELIDLASGILAGYNKTKIIEGFIARSHRHWHQIHDKKEEFFINHSDAIFSELPVSNVDAFKKLFTLVDDKKRAVIGQDDRNLIWEFLHSMVKICIKYLHNKRGPSVKIGSDGKKEAIYTLPFMEEIDIVNQCNLWNVKREFKSKRPVEVDSKSE